MGIPGAILALSQSLQGRTPGLSQYLKSIFLFKTDAGNESSLASLEVGISRGEKAVLPGGSGRGGWTVEKSVRVTH